MRRSLKLMVGAATFAASMHCLAADTYTQAEANRRVPAETHVRDAASAKAHEPETTTVRNVAAADALAGSVSDALGNDPLVSLADVEVRVESQSVFLTGTVPTLIAKERATRIAEAVKGVAVVKNDVVVVPTVELRPEEIESAARQALVANPATEAFEIQLEATPDSQLVLTGEVDSWAERELVERVVKSLVGIAGVRNEIEVAYQAARTDEEIQQEISRLLRWDVSIDDRAIEVDVNDGRVVLSGTVRSAAEKRRVIGVAHTAGTQSVETSKLVVRSSPNESRSAPSKAPVPDTEIAAAVRRFVSREPLADNQQIEVSVERGVVKLSGDVETLAAKRTLVRRAADVLGVRNVDDRLNVRTSDESSQDRRIEDQVVASLASNSLTEAYEISVGVNDGTVHLAGEVDSWFERDAAEAAVANVRGVRSIENDLIVRRSGERVGAD